MIKYSGICGLGLLLLSTSLLAENNPAITKKNFNVENSEIQTKISHGKDPGTNQKKNSQLPIGMAFKKGIKPSLKTVLPFNSFCGNELSIIPPNKQLAMEFAEKTAIQSFTYDYKNKSDQWFELEKCYTNLGWKSFTKAMSTSGNNQSIIDEKLFIKAIIDGEVEILDINSIAPSWKVLVPIKVRYENETHFFVQHLNVKVVVSIEKQRLGVDQIIASPILEKHKYEKPLDTFKTKEK